MKVPVSWLREYVDFGLPLEDLARKLVFTSCEVDRIIPRGVSDVDGNLGKFLVGKVLEAGKHPNADRLQLCQVDVGEGEPRQIVCGAWNFGAGATVAVALPGALLPGAEQPLGEAKLRGELSRGMILSEREIELGADHSGIMVLADGLEPGTPLADVLPLTDDVLDIETGFNRPDLASIYGIAREVAAVTGGALAPPPGRDPDGGAEEQVDVRVEDFEGCPRYVGRLFRGATVGESPLWLKARLLAAGMRPISNVVDVTNYVMLALGSPLHAFDVARLDGGTDRRPAGEAGREAAHARRARARADARRPRDRRRDAPRRDRRDHGRRGERGAPGDDGPAARGGELRPAHRPAHVASAAAPHRVVDALGEGRRPVRRGAGCGLRDAAVRGACRGTLDRTHRRARGTARAPARHAPPRARRPAERPAHPGGGADRTPALDRLRGRRRPRGDGSHVARARRDAPVDLVEEVVRFRIEDVPATLPRAPREARPADARPAAAAAGRGRPRRRRLPRGVHVDARAARRRADPAAGAVHRRARGAPRQPRPLARRVGAPESQRRGRADRALRAGAGLPSERRRAARGALARGGDHGRRLLPRQRRRGDAPSGAARRARPLRQLDVRRLDEGWGYFEVDLDVPLRACAGRRPLRGRHHLPGRQARPRLRRRRRGQRRRPDRRGEAGRGGGAPRAQALRRLPGRAGRPGKKSIAFSASFQSPERTLTDEDAARLRGLIATALAERFGAQLRA